jgi:hypothetical protein
VRVTSRTSCPLSRYQSQSLYPGTRRTYALTVGRPSSSCARFACLSGNGVNLSMLFGQPDDSAHLRTRSGSSPVSHDRSSSSAVSSISSPRSHASSAWRTWSSTGRGSIAGFRSTRGTGTGLVRAIAVPIVAARNQGCTPAALGSERPVRFRPTSVFRRPQTKSTGSWQIGRAQDLTR